MWFLKISISLSILRNINIDKDILENIDIDIDIDIVCSPIHLLSCCHFSFYHLFISLDPSFLLYCAVTSSQSWNKLARMNDLQNNLWPSPCFCFFYNFHKLFLTLTCGSWFDLPMALFTSNFPMWVVFRSTLIRTAMNCNCGFSDDIYHNIYCKFYDCKSLMSSRAIKNLEISIDVLISTCTDVGMPFCLLNC